MRRKLSVRRACELLGISRRWLGYEGVRADRRVVERLLDLAKRYPRYGYWMLHPMLQQALAKAGVMEKVNVKRVRRLCQVHGLTLRRKGYGKPKEAFKALLEVGHGPPPDDHAEKE